MMLGLQRLRCRRVRQALWDYVAERLSEGPMEHVEQHLTSCAACRREMESMRRAQTLLSACRQESIPPPRSDWNALRTRLQTEGLATSVAAERHRHQQHTHSHRIDRALAPRRSRWIYSISISGAFAVLLLLVATGYRSLHTVTAVVEPSGTPADKSIAANLPLKHAPNTKESTTDFAEVGNSKYANASWDNSSRSVVKASGPAVHAPVKDLVLRRQPVTSGRATKMLAFNARSGPQLHSRINPDNDKHKQDHSPLFRPYKPHPGDALPPSSTAEDHYLMESVVPVSYIPSDRDTPY